MPTPLPELFAQVPALDDPAQPFSFHAVDGTIVGSWDIVKAQTLYPQEYQYLNSTFTVTVRFDERKGTYTTTDHLVETNGSLNPLGGGFSMHAVRGRTWRKSFSFSLGGITATSQGLSPVLAYSFDTDRIKEPLTAFLEANGWKRKKGLFG